MMDLTVDWQQMYKEMKEDRDKWAECARERLMVIRELAEEIGRLRGDADAMRDRMRGR